MTRNFGAPIPDDWDGETWRCILVDWPDSAGWQAVLFGILELASRGRFWAGRTGTITDAQQVGWEIRNRNIPLRECDMAAIDDITINCETGTLTLHFTDDTTKDLSIDCIRTGLIYNALFSAPDQMIFNRVNQSDLTVSMQDILDQFISDGDINCGDKTLAFNNIYGGLLTDIDLTCLRALLTRFVSMDCDREELVVNRWNASGTALNEYRTDMRVCLGLGKKPYVIPYEFSGTSTDEACDYSYNFYLWLEETRLSISAGLHAGDTIAQMVARMDAAARYIRTDIPADAWRQVMQQMMGWGATNFDNGITQQDNNNLGCVYYCALTTYPQSEYEQWQYIAEYLDIEYPGSENLTYLWFISFVNLLDVQSFKNAIATYQFENSDCSACTCVWRHEFDFELNDGGWVEQTAGRGEWMQGTGWVHEDTPAGGAIARNIGIQVSIEETYITYIAVYHETTCGIYGPECSAWAAFRIREGSNVLASQSCGTNSPFSWSGAPTAITQILVNLLSDCNSSPTGSTTIKKIVVRGLGENPFI